MICYIDEMVENCSCIFDTSAIHGGRSRWRRTTYRMYKYRERIRLHGPRYTPLKGGTENSPLEGCARGRAMHGAVAEESEATAQAMQSV